MISKIALALVVLAALLFTGAWLALYPPFPRLPELAQGTRGGTKEAAIRAFQARVDERFPLPIREADLVDALAAQGFTLRTADNTARFEKWRFPCRRFWTISWEAEGETVTALDASYHYVCL